MAGWGDVADEDLLAAVADVQRARNAVEARMLAVVGEVEARGIAAERGFKDTVDLLRTVQKVGAGAAKARVRAARAAAPRHSLHGEALPAAMPETAQAVAAAEISLDHVVVIERTLAALPPHLVAEHQEPLEQDLAEQARLLDPDALRRVGRHALAMLDPDGPRPRHGDPTRTRLRFLPRGEGFEARGWFDREAAAIIRTALSPLAAPTGEHEAGECTESGCEHGPGESRPDPRSMAERDGDALVELCRRMLNAGALPVEGGTRPHITVTISLQDLRQDGAGLLEFGDGLARGVIRAEDARRLACDAGVIPVLLGSDGQPFDVGRKHRVVPHALRRALAARDGGCAFPGCGMPAQWCEGHHVRHWVHGGETSLNNTVLLCARHHRLIHRGEWTVTVDAGLPSFHPPWWSGGPPGRNVVHRPDLLGRVPAPCRPAEQVSPDDLVALPQRS